jgi:hypothetical protein
MTIATNREHLDNGADGGCRVRGLAREVIDGGGTTTQLTVGQSGALCLFNTAAGQIYTLPAIGADDVGMTFDFAVVVTGTGSYSIDTSDAATFIGGGIAAQSTTAGGADFFPGTIASDVSIDLDDTTTGEDVGGYLTLTSISTTQWIVSGFTAGSGTLATPFA